MEPSRYLERYTTPTNLDKADFGTVCKVIIDKEKQEHELYIQLSQEDKPNWQRLGLFFEQVFDEEFISNGDFIGTCLDIYKDLQEEKNDTET